MNITDPIADFLTRLRNAKNVGLTYAVVPASKLKIEMTKLLEAEGFIHGYRLIKDTHQGIIKIALKYDEHGKPVLKGLKRVSKPGLRVYQSVKEFKRVRAGLGLTVLSTSKGIITSKTAHAENVGGEVLAYIW